MKEENGKILLQPSFIKQQQQQQTQHITTKLNNNNMTNKHKTTTRRRTLTMAGLPKSTTFPRLQRTISQEDEEEEQHQHFSTLHPILKRSKKNQSYQLLKRNQQIS